MSDPAVPAPIADERTRRIFGELHFSTAKKGFDPAEVTAFLVNASGAVERMLARLKTAEQRAESAEQRASQLESRALDPAAPAAPTANGAGVPAVPGPNGEDNGVLLDRTLALAEKTAIAAVADARSRAQAILTEAQEQARQYFASERAAIATEWERLQTEAGQLETLRLAVAAETMALEGVRSQLRARLAATASELAAISDNPDLLHYAISQNRMEVPAPAPAPVATPPPVAAIEGADERARPEGVHVDAIPASSVASYEKSFQAGWEHEQEDHTADEAFARFFSDEVEPEPTQQWILAG